MAFPAELVKIVSRTLGVPMATVAQHDRNLAVAGIREVRGRGRSARHVTPENAANLLISIAAGPPSGPTLKDSAETARRYGSFTSARTGDDGIRRLATWPAKLQNAELRRLPEGHTLSASLAALIRAFMRRELDQAKVVWPDHPWPAEIAFSFTHIQVELHWPLSRASIELTTRALEADQRMFSISEQLEFGMPAPSFKTLQELEEWRLKLKMDSPGPRALRQVRSFDDSALRDIAFLLSHGTLAGTMYDYDVPT